MSPWTLPCAGSVVSCRGQESYQKHAAVNGMKSPACVERRRLMQREEGVVAAKNLAGAKGRQRLPFILSAWSMAAVAVVLPGVLMLFSRYTAAAAQGAGETAGLGMFPDVLTRLVTNPYVAAILFSLGLLGIVVEVLTPGFGIPGTLGLLFLALFFGAHVVAGLAGWWAFLLVLLGLLLLVIEVFIPGFGIAGLLGLAAIIAAVFIVSPNAGQAVTILAAALLIVGASVILLSRLAAENRGLWRHLALGDSLTGERGYTAHSYPADLLGQTGVTVTQLRPAGTIHINGQPWDVVSEGSFIDQGVTVIVVEVSGNRIVVRRQSH